MSVAKEFEAANAKYASSFTKGSLALPPARYINISGCHAFALRSDCATCVGGSPSWRAWTPVSVCSPFLFISRNQLRLMGLSVDPARALGLDEGDAHVIRNAGGRVTDAIRSIVISQQLLGTREIVIVHHVRPLSGYRIPI